MHLSSLITAYLKTSGAGLALAAPYPLRLGPEKFREPDLLVALTDHTDRLGEEYADRADLVFEVVSKDRRKDLEIKRVEYAQAAIPEYWIVDPQEQQITVLTLADIGEYTIGGVFIPGQTARSRLIPGFEVDVTAVFAAGRGEH
jgi:Uma2 family endonuclease